MIRTLAVQYRYAAAYRCMRQYSVAQKPGYRYRTAREREQQRSGTHE